jgi:hypothetical protein
VVAISDDFAFETLRQVEVVREDVARVNGIAIAVALVIDTVTRIVSPTGIVQHGGSPPSNAARLKPRAPTERLLSGSSRRPTELPIQRVAGPRKSLATNIVCTSSVNIRSGGASAASVSTLSLVCVN